MGTTIDLDGHVWCEIFHDELWWHDWRYFCPHGLPYINHRYTEALIMTRASPPAAILAVLAIRLGSFNLRGCGIRRRSVAQVAAQDGDRVFGGRRGNLETAYHRHRHRSTQDKLGAEVTHHRGQIGGVV